MPSNKNPKLRAHAAFADDEETSAVDQDQLGKFEDGNISYLQFMEARGATGMDMLSQQGLEFQAEYIKQWGNNQHPLDVARRLSLNPFAAPKDRLAACKLIMEYSMRKIPAQLELSGKDGKPISLDSNALRNLSDKELDTLMHLLEKANGK